jgi:hypothetical protein
MSLRNIVTNIAGAIGSLWIGFEATQNKLTMTDLSLGVPAIVTSFATGSKDDRLKLMQQQLDRLGLTEGDKKAAAGMVQMGLNQLAHRVGLQVLPYDLDNSDSVGDRDVGDRATLRGNPVDTARRQSGDYGDRLNADTLERIADGVDYVDRGPTPDPAARAARYFQQRPAAPVVGSPEIEGAGISAVEFSARSMGGNGQTEGFARLEEQQW